MSNPIEQEAAAREVLEIETMEYTAPRITEEEIRDNVVNVEVIRHTTVSGQILRWAILTTKNGFAVTGEPSVAVSPANDNPELGGRIAVDNAMMKLWEFMGYALKEKLYNSEKELTPFRRVADMNTAFGNIKGVYTSIDWAKINSQCQNIQDEFNELMEAVALLDPEGVRDALCDIQVFANGAQHMMGVDGDADMHAVVDGVMTRFIKDDVDRDATQIMHANKGVTEVYFEGEYPKMIMKSATAQPDAPKGKFLKSASYTNTVFPPVQ